MARRPTVTDVAAAAGVSPKTVSNVVNGYQHVRPATRARVQAQIDALGYRPYAAGRHLRQGRTGMVALAVPGVDMPYFAELAAELVREARHLGLTVAVEQTDGDVEREREVAAGLPVRFADGLVFSPLELTADELVGSPSVPMVLLGEHASGVPVDRVGIDSVAVAETAVGHLLERGRRRVALVGRKAHVHDTALQRIQGYHRALAAVGLEPDPGLAPLVEDWTREDGATAGRAIAHARREGRGPLADVDAVFALSDVLALGVLRELRAGGVRVPDDVAVVGIDDIAESAFAEPGLTTVAIDRAAIAREALRLLMSRFADRTLPPRAVEAPHRLVVRSST